jgi:energy-converting hydrogenase Eha subunit G
MFIYSALLLLVNRRTLPEEIRPGIGRIAALVWAFLLFGFLSVLVFNEQFQKLFGG